MNHKPLAGASLILLFFFLPAFAWPQASGITPEWDIRQTLKGLSAEVQRLTPILDELKPQDWVAKGAAEAYVDQWKSTRNEIDYLAQTVEGLEKDPQRITLTLEAYFRLQAIEGRIYSLGEAVRRYQNAALADLLSAVMSENAANRDKLRQYLVDLVATKEAEFKIIDEEAQRCRSLLLRQPAARARTGGKQESK